MSWFSKFLGTPGNDGSSSNNQLVTPASENDVNVLEDLFVNKNAPVVENDKEGKYSIKTYLEQDFFHRGYNDGYDYHSAEILENRTNSLKADFRFNLSQKIDQARADIVELENHKIDVDGMSQRMVKQLDNRIAALRDIMNELESEIAMSALDEGSAMIGIYQYRDGYIRGTEAYQAEKLIAGSTGMFN